MATQRKLRPRATDALNVTPATVSDRTCAAIFGLEPRVFRDLLVREHVAHAQIGRRLVARVDAVLDVIDRLAGADAASTSVTPAAPPDELGTVDDVLAILGRRRSA